MIYPMTPDQAIEAGVEMLVVQYLPLPSDKTCELLSWLSLDITAIDTVPIAVYDEAIPEYLSTGRPLALLDLKHKDQYPFDRLIRLVTSDPWLCERVLAGLEAGLSSNRMRRAKAYTRNDTETAQALSALEKVVEGEIKKITDAKLKLERKAAQPKSAQEGKTSKARKGASWADSEEVSARTATPAGPVPMLPTSPTPSSDGYTAPAAPAQIPIVSPPVAPRTPAPPAMSTNVPAITTPELIPLDGPAPAYAAPEAKPPSSPAGQTHDTHDALALFAAELSKLDSRVTAPRSPASSHPNPPQDDQLAARMAEAGLVQPQTMSTPTALSSAPTQTPSPASKPKARQNPHATWRI